MAVSGRSAIPLGLAGVLNLSVFIMAWDFMGLFRDSLPPQLGVVVIRLLLVATLLTVVGEVLILTTDDGNIGVGLVPFLGVFLHLVLAALLAVQSFTRGFIRDVETDRSVAG